MIRQSETRELPPPPKMRGLPFFGNAPHMISNPLQFMIDSYHKYGSAYRAVVLGREVYVIAGIEANRLLANADESIISKSGFYGGLASEFGDTNYFTASDGESYKELRSQVRSGYSRQRAANLIPDIVNITRQRTKTWQTDSDLNVIKHLEKLIADLIGFVVVNTPASSIHEDYRRIIETLMMVHAARIWSSIMLHFPKYKASLKKGYAFAADMIDWHRQNPPGERHHDLIDDLLQASDENGQPLSEKTMQVQAMTPLMVGIDTGTSAAAFLARCLLHTPDALKQVQAEVDGLFENGIPTYDDFREAHCLHAAFMETIRLHPISPFIARRAESDFEFEGYLIPAGADVMIANGVAHYLPEFFENPREFRLDRPRPEQHSYMPFGAGTHVCMGSGIADIIVATAIATILHDYDIELVGNSDKVFINPVPNPGHDFQFRLRERTS